MQIIAYKFGGLAKTDYLCIMKMKKNAEPVVLTQEEVFRRKTRHYLVCFIESCPLRERCLRWLVGQHVETLPLAYNAINPRNPRIGGEKCEMFRENKKAMMKRGLTRLYDHMPGRMEHRIRLMLISMWGRKQYFEMRRGDRLINPSQQQDVIDACRYHGWTGPIVYDGEQEDWDW